MGYFNYFSPKWHCNLQFLCQNFYYYIIHFLDSFIDSMLKPSQQLSKKVCSKLLCPPSANQLFWEISAWKIMLCHDPMDVLGEETLIWIWYTSASVSHCFTLFRLCKIYSNWSDQKNFIGRIDLVLIIC